jgi:LysM repeat protein
MWKERKICIRITPRRVMGSILIAACAVNLLIVGVAFEVSASMATPTVTVSQTIPPSGPTEGLGVTATLEPTGTPTSTFTHTPTLTFTPTASATFTSSPSPSVTLCAPWDFWPVYIVQGGDTLYSLAIATGSSVDELMLANCLPNTRIDRGQRLYVPRLPITTVTPSVTPPTPANSPAEFEPDLMSCRYPKAVSFAVWVHDPEGIQSVEVRVYARVKGAVAVAAQIPMARDGDTYYGSGDLSEPFTVYDIAYYSFYAVDSFNDDTISPAYEERSSGCIEYLRNPYEGTNRYIPQTNTGEGS